VAAAGETTAPSRMEQSVDVGGALLLLVQLASLLRDHEDDRFAREKQRERNDRPRVGREFPPKIDDGESGSKRAEFEQDGSLAYSGERLRGSALSVDLGRPQLYS
jgi:hypothetical protein